MEDKSTRTDDSQSPATHAASSSSAAAEAAVTAMANCDVNANKDRFLCAVCSVTICYHLPFYLRHETRNNNQ